MAEQVREFNLVVRDLRERRNQVPVEVERYIQQIYGPTVSAWPRGLVDAARLAKHQELVGALERRWREAFHTYIDEGERTAVAMLKEGPTWEHLRAAREAGYLPQAQAAVFVAGWGRSAAIDEAGRISQLILDGGQVSLEELERLGQMLTEYASDEQFAHEFLTQLGPEGLLELTATVGAFGRPGSGEQFGEELRVVQTGLAVTLATATVTRWEGGSSARTSYQPGEYGLPPEWLLELTRAGSELFQVDHPEALRSQVYGYQALAVLLSHGGFDAQFLIMVGGDLIDFERAQGGSGFWAEEAPGHNLPFRLNWVHGAEPTDPLGLDPMVGLMQALTESPEAAKQVLAGAVRPSPDGEPDRLLRLDYLLTDREWPVDLPSDPAAVMHFDQHPEQRVSSGIPALGRVLEVATTVDPDHRSYRIVESIIYEIAHDEQAKGFPNGQPDAPRSEPFSNLDIVHDQLRPHLARIVDSYIQEIHWITADMAHPNPELAGTVELRFHSGVAERDLRLFLAELGKNLEARDIVLAAELSYVKELYERCLAGWDGTDPSVTLRTELNVTSPAANVMAALDFGAAGRNHADLVAEDAQQNETLRRRYFWVGLGVSAVTDPVPGGAAGNHFAQTALEMIEEQNQHSSVGEANYYTGDLREAAREMLKDMVNMAAIQALTQELGPEDVVRAVAPEHQPLIEGLLYPPGHPQAGELRAVEEWTRADFDAWDAFVGAPGYEAVWKLRDETGEQYNDAFDTTEKDIENETRRS